MRSDLLQYVELMASVVKAQPQMLAMVHEQQFFPEIERDIVAMIANASSPANGLLAYEKYGSLIPDWKFVFATDTGAIPGFAVNREFSDGSVVRSLFKTDRVIVLDPGVRDAMFSTGEAKFPIDYSIGLDTQALSYLAPYIDMVLRKH